MPTPPPTTPIRAVARATTALMALPGLVAALNEIPLELEFTDQSPLFTFVNMPVEVAAGQDPSAAWGTDTDWKVEYSGSNRASWSPNSVGVGTSAHKSDRPSSAVMLDFVGNAVEVYGTVMGVANIMIDTITVSQSRDGKSVASYSGLKQGSHKAVLRVGGDSELSITGAKVTTSIFSEDATSLKQVPITDVYGVLDGKPNPVFSGWNLVQGKSSPSLCHDNGDKPPLQFDVPPNTAFMELWGPSGFEFAKDLRINISPAPTNGLSTHSGIIFNPWESGPNLMFFTTLDHTAKYTVTLINGGAARTLACLHKAVFYSGVGVSSGTTRAAQPTAGWAGASPKETGGASTGAGSGSDGAVGTGGGGNKTNVGAIAGGVVGGVAALAGLLFLFFYLRRRKRNDRSREQAMFKATSDSHGRPGSWQPFFSAIALGSQGSRSQTSRSNASRPSKETARTSRDLELIPPSFGDFKSSRHTSMQTYASTAGSTPMTPHLSEFGAPILPYDEMSKFTPTPYAHSIPSQASLPPINESPPPPMPPQRPLPPGHSFATINSLPTGPPSMGHTIGSSIKSSTMAPSIISSTVGSTTARSALTSPSTDTVDSVPNNWPSPPTSPPRPGPRPPPRKHMSRGSMSPPASPNPPSIAMQPWPTSFD